MIFDYPKFELYTRLDLFALIFCFCHNLSETYFRLSRYFVFKIINFMCIIIKIKKNQIYTSLTAKIKINIFVLKTTYRSVCNIIYSPISYPP